MNDRLSVGQAYLFQAKEDLWEARGKYEIEQSSILITMYADSDCDGFVPDGQTMVLRYPNLLTNGCRKSFYVNVIHLNNEEN